MNNALWYLGRGTGISALLLLTLVVLLGILVRSGRSLPGTPRFAIAAVHRTTSLSAVAFLGIHIGTLLLDPYAQLKLLDTVVPFTARYRPLWQGLGTVALDLIVVLIASSLVRHRLGLRTWRAIHWLAYACWPIAIAHALGNGTDAGSRWLLTLVIGCIACVVVTGVWRVTGREFDPVSGAVDTPLAIGGRR